MKMTTFNIPTVAGQREAHGYRVRLLVGDKRIAFMLQLDGKQPSQLSHWASGYKVTSLRDLALRRFVATGYRASETPAYWRKLAQIKLDEIVASKGAETVLAVIGNAPVINGGPTHA